jgi:hypothetical protein
MKKIILLFSLVTFSSYVFAQKIPTISLNKTQIPSQIKYLGKLIDAFQFSDSEGKHFLITSETGIYSTPKYDDFRNAKINAQHYIEKNGKLVQTWKINDAILDCSLDLEATFLKNSIQVTDLDKDGKAEIWIPYKLGCYGDVSPRQMKIIMYRGQQKFAMRGETKLHYAGKTYGGGFKFDNAFLKQDKLIQDFARKLWNTCSPVKI